MFETLKLSFLWTYCHNFWFGNCLGYFSQNFGRIFFQSSGHPGPIFSSPSHDHQQNDTIVANISLKDLPKQHRQWRKRKTVLKPWQLAGALGSVLVTEDKWALTGASGGFYALMAAHAASLLLNWESDTLIFRQRTTQVKSKDSFTRPM
jgi:hypothetical protein